MGKTFKERENRFEYEDRRVKIENNRRNKYRDEEKERKDREFSKENHKTKQEFR